VNSAGPTSALGTRGLLRLAPLSHRQAVVPLEVTAESRRLSVVEPVGDQSTISFEENLMVFTKPTAFFARNTASFHQLAAFFTKTAATLWKNTATLVKDAVI